MTSENEKKGADTNLRCEIVRDLLPLYHDNVVSEITGRAVEDHLKTCPTCGEAYDALCAELPEPVQNKNVKKNFLGTIRKLRRKGVVIGAAAAAGAAAIICGAWYVLTVPALTEVPADEIEIYNLYKYYNETDGYDHLFIRYSIPSKYHSGNMSGKVSDNGSSLDLSIKKAVIIFEDTDSFDSESDYWDIPLLSGDYVSVTLNGSVICDFDDYVFEEAPEYLIEYGKNNWNYMESGDGYVTIYYNDGSYKTWDYDGNLLYEGTDDPDNIDSGDNNKE